MHTYILQLFFNSPENRKMNMIIESISAVSEKIPPNIIINGKRRMDNWFNTNLDPETIINISDTGYTNNWIGVDFLKHFIKHTKSSSTSRYKMLLFNSAESHETDEFKQLANDHNIILVRYPPHLIYLMQPLDVGCFQSYKHWHNRAVHVTARTECYSTKVKGAL
jgi:DDE superfamily endonuclease